MCGYRSQKIFSRIFGKIHVYTTETTHKLSELTFEMGVSMTSDLVRLNSNSYYH